MSGPLAGLRVVELATAIQGPAVGLHFANMGADVVKVEPPIGDGSRYHRGVDNALPADAYCAASQFVAMNKGKRSLCADVNTPAGAAVMERLLEQADVFISNYRASALTRMGLDLDALSRRYPRLVVGHVNGFGPLGPDAEKAMLDGAAQARGGLASVSGHAGDVPMLAGAAVADHGGAMQLALGCVTALLARARTGRGQVVRTSSLGAQLWLQMWELQQSFLTGVPLTRGGPHHPNISAPYGIYQTRDGVFVIFVHAMTDEAWADFWIFVDKPEVLLLDEWNTPGKRIGALGAAPGVDNIRALMREAFAARSWSEVEAFLTTQPEIIWERVRDHAEVRTDEQNLANDYIVDIDLPVIGRTSTVGALMAFSDTPAPAPAPPPPLGAHTAEIMRGLGFGDSDINAVESHVQGVRASLMAAAAAAATAATASAAAGNQ